MGANLSSILTDPNVPSMYNSLYLQPWSSPSSTSPAAAMIAGSRTNLGDLPESCVALIVANLDPLQICQLARLNRAFRGASWADFIWETKLPGNYMALVERVFGDCHGHGDGDGDGDGDGGERKLNKREIYTRLCRANSFDGGTKQVWLHKGTAGVCLSVSSRGLAITGIDDRRYWNHIPTEESRFSSVAYLQQIWWFEVDGQFEFPFPAGTYSLFFRLQLGRATKRFGRRVCNTEHVHGWDIKPVQFQLWTSDGQHASSKCYLDDPGKWNLYHVGDFVVDCQNGSTNLKFSMTQIDCTHTKGGLCLDSVLVYPSHFRERLKHF